MRLKQTVFGGIAPKQLDNNMAVEFASIAENVNLERGSIKPWRVPKKVFDDVGKSIYVKDCCAIAAPCEASFAEVGLNCDKVVAATGVMSYPVFSDSCPPNWQRLGFACNMPAPLAEAADVVQDFTMEKRSYYYTAVNSQGWESQPSFPSDWVSVNTNKPVVISGITAPDTAVSIRIYRAQSQLDFGAEQKDDLEDTAFLFVGEIDAGGDTFIDTVQVAGHACMTEEYGAPPRNLREICSWREGRLAGLSGNTFVMSERSAPHGWNDKYTVTFYDTAIALKCTGKKAYVMTDGRPVIISINGDCAEGNPLSVHELAQSLPIVSRRSAAVYLDGVIYASDYGLIWLNESGTAVLTGDYYTASQWAKLRPNTMRGAVYGGYYYGITDVSAIRLQLPSNIFPGNEKAVLTTLSIRPEGLYVTDTDELYLAMDDGIYQWNAGGENMLFTWEGKTHDFQGKVRLSGFSLETSGNVEVTHKVDTGAIQTVDNVGNKPVRLPVGFSGRDWRVRIRGKHEVYSYNVATSIRDLVHD